MQPMEKAAKIKVKIGKVKDGVAKTNIRYPFMSDDAGLPILMETVIDFPPEMADMEIDMDVQTVFDS